MGTAATPPPEMPRIQQLLRNHISQRPILHLSFFDGIGAASVALQYLGANIVFTLSWETNPQCQALLQHHFQSIQHGDVSILTRPQLNEIIRHAAQGTEDLIILITAGPPCVDFSRLRNQPPGMQGEQGNLLSRQTEIILGIKEDWSHLYLILSLLENVVPHKAVSDQFQDITSRLGTTPMVIDAKDGGIISRPRLWWFDIDWDSATQQLHSNTPWQITQTFHQTMWHLTNPIAAQLQPDVQVKDWETPTVLQHNQLFHCLTTQASSDEGRPPPRSSHVDNETWQRWEDNNKQFPPWQYRPEYLTRYKDGQWQTVTPLHRERMMGFPDNYTNTPPADDRTRNSMLGNTWHVPTAIWLLFLMLLSTNTQAIPVPVRYSNIEKMATIWKATATAWGPADHSTPQHHMPQFDWTQHLHWTRTHYERGHQPKPIDPTLHWAIQQQRDIPNIQQVRQDIIREIQTMTTEWDDVTQHWFTTLPAHCKLAYRQPHMITQIPVLHHILTTIHYPHADILFQELTTGFSLIGQLQPGLNWKVRTDNKYTETQSRAELHTYNRQYILKKLQQGRIDTHWQMMADEIAKEVQMGRMDGPFRAPKWWTRRSVPLQRHKHTANLKPLPHSDPIIALAFSIEQTGSDGKAKIRRGEDWRRSGHNRSCNMTDQPYHHTPDHYLWLAQHTAASDQTPQQVWGHDHDGAYRQLPLDDPSLAYVLLLTPEGPTLWLHHVLLFGSAASVWSYNRFGDVLTSLSRVLTATPVVHFVDDYGSIQPTTHAMSGFQAFGHLNSTLGFHMKTSKEQPPQHEHKIQGVCINTDSTHITIKPCKQRIQQITTTLQQAIDTNSLQPSLAQKLAGKCAFTATQLFGKVGRAANRALYDHAFSNHTHLDKPTRQGILAMINILQHAQPRVAPLVPDTFQPTIIYTDAYYQIDGVHKRCCDLTEEDLQHAHKDLPNGWGIVVFSPGKPPIVTSGHVPPNLLHQFTSSRAFIYFLEAWTAVIAPVLFQPILTKPYIQLCDNEASKHAILKGTGKHQPLNNIIGAHWTWHNRYQLHQILDRVPSKANIADPFSRGDFDIAHKHGWKILRTPHKEILQRTFKIIGDALFAHTTGFSNLSGLQAFHDML